MPLQSKRHWALATGSGLDAIPAASAVPLTEDRAVVSRTVLSRVCPPSPHAISLLQEFKRVTRGQFPGTVTIAEESTAWAGVARPADAAGLGFSMKWNMGRMNEQIPGDRQQQLATLQRQQHRQRPGRRCRTTEQPSPTARFLANSIAKAGGEWLCERDSGSHPPKDEGGSSGWHGDRAEGAVGRDDRASRSRPRCQGRCPIGKAVPPRIDRAVRGDSGAATHWRQVAERGRRILAWGGAVAETVGGFPPNPPNAAPESRNRECIPYRGSRENGASPNADPIVPFRRC